MNISPSKKLTNIAIYLICTLLLIFVISFAVSLISNQQNQNQNQDQQAKTIEQAASITIIDGDTFQTANGETIRLLCVDTPELGTKGSEEAKAYLSALILGKDIAIETAGAGADKYNRTLAWVYSSDKSILVNKEIVDSGFGSFWDYNETDCGRMKS